MRMLFLVEVKQVQPIEIGKLALAQPTAAAANQRSFFAVGLHKAGSSLLADLFHRLAPGYRYVPYNLHQALYDLGLHAQDVAVPGNEFFRPFGLAYIGFRGWPPCHGLPDWARQRVVHLVRDPRDVMVSLYYSIARSHVSPALTEDTANLTRQFRDNRDYALSQGIDGFVLAWANKVCREYAETFDALRPANPRIWRYEDVIFNKVAWAKDMLRHLEMEPPPGDTLQQIIRPLDVLPSSEDPARHIRQVRPGDHRAKLAGATIEKLSETFAPILSRHGYA